MAEYPARGISESELIREIIELYKDARMYKDKLESYDNGEGETREKDLETTQEIYIQHLSRLDAIRGYVKLGRKYFSCGKTNWDFLDPSLQWPTIPSCMEARDLLKGVVSGGDYSLANIDDDILGFR